MNALQWNATIGMINLIATKYRLKDTKYKHANSTISFILNSKYLLFCIALCTMCWSYKEECGSDSHKSQDNHYLKRGRECDGRAMASGAQLCSPSWPGCWGHGCLLYKHSFYHATKFYIIFFLWNIQFKWFWVYAYLLHSLYLTYFTLLCLLSHY